MSKARVVGGSPSLVFGFRGKRIPDRLRNKTLPGRSLVQGSRFGVQRLRFLLLPLAAAFVCLLAATALAGPPQKQTLSIPVTFPAPAPRRFITNQCLVTCGRILPVATVAFSPDGKTLAAGGYREIVLWDLSEGKLARRIGAKQLGGAVQAVAFSRDGALLVAGEGRPGVSGVVRVFEAATGRLTESFQEPKDVVYSLALSGDGQYVAAGAADGAAYVWKLADRKLVATLKEHNAWVQAVAFSPDGKWLATGGADRSLFVWSTSDWKMLTHLTQPEPVTGAVFAPGGTNVIWTVGGAENKSLRGRKAVEDPEEPVAPGSPRKRGRPRRCA